MELDQEGLEVEFRRYHNGGIHNNGDGDMDKVVPVIEGVPDHIV